MTKGPSWPQPRSCTSGLSGDRNPPYTCRNHITAFVGRQANDGCINDRSQSLSPAVSAAGSRCASTTNNEDNLDLVGASCRERFDMVDDGTEQIEQWRAVTRPMSMIIRETIAMARRAELFFKILHDRREDDGPLAPAAKATRRAETPRLARLLTVGIGVHSRSSWPLHWGQALLAAFAVNQTSTPSLQLRRLSLRGRLR